MELEKGKKSRKGQSVFDDDEDSLYENENLGKEKKTEDKKEKNKLERKKSEKQKDREEQLNHLPRLPSDIQPGRTPRFRKAKKSDKKIKKRKASPHNFSLGALRDLPILLTEKRELKKQFLLIANPEKDKLSRYERWSKKYRTFEKKLKQLGIWKNSLSEIEAKSGTSIVNVFYFLRWTFWLNVAISLIIYLIFIIPYWIIAPFDYSKINSEDCNMSTDPKAIDKLGDREFLLGSTPDSDSDSDEIRVTCCTFSHLNRTKDRATAKEFFGSSIGITSEFRSSPLFLGYYTTPDYTEAEHKDSYNLTIAFIASIIIIYFICLMIMIKFTGEGIEEVILSHEGEVYVFCNLVFVPWEHFTTGQKASQFKRNIVLNDLKLFLEIRRKKAIRQVKGKWNGVRILFIRLLINTIVLALMALVGAILYGISVLTYTMLNQERNNPQGRNQTRLVFISFLPSIVIHIINQVTHFILPRLGKFEETSQNVYILLILLRAICFRVTCFVFTVGKFFSDGYCHNEKNRCIECEKPAGSTSKTLKESQKYREPCWESFIGSQFFKFLLTDLIIKLISTFVIEKIRLLLGEKCKEKRLCRLLTPIKFDIIRNSIDIIMLQILSWIGLYFAPMFPLIVTFYCVITFYIKKYSVINNCKAIPDTIKTSKSTANFIGTKFFAFLFSACIIFGIFVFLYPSKECGPFRFVSFPYEGLVSKENKSEQFITIGYILPLVMLVIIAIAFFVCKGFAYKQVLITLKHHLLLESSDKEYLGERLVLLRRSRKDKDIGRRDFYRRGRQTIAATGDRYKARRFKLNRV